MYAYDFISLVTLQVLGDRPLCTDIVENGLRQHDATVVKCRQLPACHGFLWLPGQVQRQRRPCHGLRSDRWHEDRCADSSWASLRSSCTKTSMALRNLQTEAQDGQKMHKYHANSCQLSNRWICLNRFPQTEINAITLHETCIFDHLLLTSLNLTFGSPEFPACPGHQCHRSCPCNRFRDKASQLVTVSNWPHSYDINKLTLWWSDEGKHCSLSITIICIWYIVIIYIDIHWYILLWHEMT